MLDKNGIEMITGNIVEIKNALFKNDNGIYFIANSPGDASWCGSDYGLTKMCKNGKLSTSDRNIAFWPLISFTNNRQKNADSKVHNAINATIEIINNIDTSEVINYFHSEVESLEKQATRQAWDFGEDSEIVRKTTTIVDHYKNVVERLNS